MGVAALALAAVFGCVVLRLADLQLLRRSFLISKAERQQIRVVPVLGRRGSIYDRNHESLAQSVETESVFLSVRDAKKDSLRELCSSLAAELSVNPIEIKRKIIRGRSFYVKHGARIEATARLKARKFAALSFEPESRREYPQGRLAGHVLGFAGMDGLGLEGVEKQYNKILAGQAGRKEAFFDARGKLLPSETSWITRPKDGEHLVLTLDAQFQHIAERELEKAWRKSGALSASMVVMDPSNGEILALANFPDFDPNEGTASSLFQRRNRAVNDAFEPGSTFKAVTAALALEDGVVDTDTPVDCRGGRAEYAGRVVRDHGDDHMGVVPFWEVIAQSSNVGTVEVAAKLGPRKLYDGILRFGFGRPTGIDLPGEAAGTVRPLKDWTAASMASIPYGQELSCNVLHIARIYAAVANGGRLVTPHVVREIESFSGGRRSAEQGPAGDKIFGPKVIAKLTEILEGVVEKGTGSTTALPGFRVAGKTGTAQKFNMRLKRYTMDDNVSSFVGFVPADKPQFVCAVVLDEPRGMTLGGWVAGPVFRASMSAMLSARGVVPDEKLIAAARDQPVTKSTRWTAGLKKGQSAAPVEWVKVPSLVGKGAVEAKGLLAEAGLRGIFSGNGKTVKSQFPNRSEKVRQFSTVKVLLEDVKVAEIPGATAGARP